MVVSLACQNQREAVGVMRPGASFMNRLEVVSRTDRDGGYIETLFREGMEIYYRSCAHGYCRYSSDLWQAEMYLDELLAK